MPLSAFETVIGLEVHIQLQTRTKLFCADTTKAGLPPNTQTSIISLAHPGTLPRLNEVAVAMAVKLGLALGCHINQQNYFARKNYFYADLPKGYQISQHTVPICEGGSLELDNGRAIRLNRIHMEEDAGKSMHDGDVPVSRIDFNRAGMPLLELVTEPDIRSAAEASEFVSKLRQLVRHLGVSDGDMEKGNLRCDVNISLRPLGSVQLGTKVEVKNLNSMRFIRKAVDFEEERIAGLLESGEAVLQATRGFQEQQGMTYLIRVKEDEDDYRYFPEPDLPPFNISESFIDAIRSSMPELPQTITARYQTQYGLSAAETQILLDEEALRLKFEKLVQLTNHYRQAYSWLVNTVKPLAGEAELTDLALPALAWLITAVAEGRMNHQTATQIVFPKLLSDPSLDVAEFVRLQSLEVLANTEELDRWIAEALEKFRDKIPEYKKGKKGLLAVFVGHVMKRSAGKADAKTVNEKILEELNKAL